MSWQPRTTQRRVVQPAKPWRRIGVALLMGLALTIAACGTSTGGGGAPPPTPTPKPSPTVTPCPTPAPCTTWRIIPSPNGTKYQGNGLVSVTALSPTDAWAVGANAGEGTVGPVVSLIERWDGTSWQIVANPGVAFLNSVTAVSPTDIWAIGQQFEVTGGAPASDRWATVTLHWNGTQWRIIPSANPSSVENILTSVAALSTSDVWAVGHYSTYESGAVPLIEHWNGTAWHVVASPTVPGTGHGFLTAVARIPGTQQLWAVGYTAAASSSMPMQPLIERWDGTAWQIVANPTLPSGTSEVTLNGVVALSSTDAWIVGGFYQGTLPLTAHWDGTTWRMVTNPPHVQGNLVSIAAAGAHDVRAVGYYYIDSGGHALIEQWDGTAWQKVTSPEPSGAGQSGLAGITTDGAGNYWAVGAGNGTLTLHCP